MAKQSCNYIHIHMKLGANYRTDATELKSITTPLVARQFSTERYHECSRGTLEFGMVRVAKFAFEGLLLISNGIGALLLPNRQVQQVNNPHLPITVATSLYIKLP